MSPQLALETAAHLKAAATFTRLATEYREWAREGGRRAHEYLANAERLEAAAADELWQAEYNQAEDIDCSTVENSYVPAA